MSYSDRSATVAALKDVAAKFTAERNWDQFHDPKNLAIGLVTEAAELLQHFRFRSDIQIQRLLNSRNRVELENEIADVFFMLLRLSTKIECDLAASLERKLTKNSLQFSVKRGRGKDL
jgi:NTP pyrophosphatase (non-canonical NTP hydrolase)